VIASSSSSNNRPVSLGSYLTQLIKACTDLSSGTKSADFITKMGLFIINLYVVPTSILVTFIAVPFFVILYHTEKHSYCRFNPTCKVYLIQAIEVYGPVKGFSKGIKRVLRCNPFFPSGDDPLPCTHDEV
jgi:putative membrane protein insertion efficiency factor